MKLLIEAFYTWYRKGIRNSKYRWLMVLASLVYLVSPMDIAPDIFPILGWLDDGIISTILLTEVSQLILESRKNRQSTSEITDLTAIN